MTSDATDPDDRDTGSCQPDRTGSNGVDADLTVPFRIVVPPDTGPVREFHQRGRNWTGAALVIPVGVVLFAMAAWSFEWMASWGPWLAFVGLAAIVALVLGPVKIAAGTGWLQCSKSWVDLHDLQAINFSRRVYDGRSIELKDRRGRSLMVDMNDLCANDQLWELVQTALRVSMNKGAQFNSLARKELVPVLDFHA